MLRRETSFDSQDFFVVISFLEQRSLKFQTLCGAFQLRVGVHTLTLFSYISRLFHFSVSSSTPLLRFTTLIDPFHFFLRVFFLSLSHRFSIIHRVSPTFFTFVPFAFILNFQFLAGQPNSSLFFLFLSLHCLLYSCEYFLSNLCLKFFRFYLSLFSSFFFPIYLIFVLRIGYVRERYRFPVLYSLLLCYVAISYFWSFKIGFPSCACECVCDETHPE